MAFFGPAPRHQRPAVSAKREVPAVRPHRFVVVSPAATVGAFGEFESTRGSVRRAVRRRQRGRVPVNLRTVGVDTVVERCRENARFNGERFEQRRFDQLAGSARRNPDLVGESDVHVVGELVAQSPGGTRVEIGFVLDGSRWR